MIARIHDILPQQPLRYFALLLRLPAIDPLLAHLGIVFGLHDVGVGVDGIRGRMGAAVGIHDEIRQALVFGRIDGVADDAEDVEAGEDGFGEFDVLGERDGAVVAAADGVGGGDDGAAGLEGGDDAGFGDGDGLLFHGFVDGGAVLVVHLVELVDEAGALVGEDEGAAFERPFGREGVAAHAGGETDGAGTLACGEDGAVGGFFDVFQDLRFGGSGIAEEEDVDVAADFVLALGFFADAAEEGECDCGLDVGVTVDAGSDGGDDLIADMGVARQRSDLTLVFVGQTETGHLVMCLDYVVCFEDGGEDGETVAIVELSVVVVAVNASDFDLFSRLGRIDQIPEEDDFSMTRQTAGGYRSWRLLESEFLIVAVDGLF